MVIGVGEMGLGWDLGRGTGLLDQVEWNGARWYGITW